jgi:PAS domain S-box-containing protein
MGRSDFGRNPPGMQERQQAARKPRTSQRKIKCWELFRCEENDCPAYKSRNLRCWLFSGTHCRNELQGQFIEKIEMCLGCDVLRKNEDVDAMKETLSVVDRQFKEYSRVIGERDRQLEGMSMELAIGLSEVFEALKKIASGDPTVRIPEDSEIELIGKLKNMINLTGEEIGEIVDQAHEIAIGLAEHFDVLNRVSRGDLQARATGASDIELLESLKTVTNDMIESISREIGKRIKAEEVLKERTRDLWERVKEINCLYSISELAERRGIGLEELLQGIVDRITFGWRYPEAACARILIEGGEFSTMNFIETCWVQKSTIPLYGNPYGTVEVCYVEEKPAADEGPFTKEERNLLDAIANHCGRFIERIRNRQILRQSEEKYRTVFENTGSATLIVEADMTVSLVNTKFEELSGYRKGEIEGKKSWRDFFHEDDIEKMREYHHAVRERTSSAPSNYEARLIDKHGGVSNVLLSVSIIPGTASTVESLVDITERKKLEEQMLQAEKLASIGTLAAGVAHEINNPLAVILGFTDLLMEKTPPESEACDLLQTIQKQGNNAKRIVENLLSFVRYREYKEEAIEINRVIEELLMMKSNAMMLNNIEVVREMGESLRPVRGDPGEMQQVFFNVINNAIAAMKGGGVLRIGTRMRESEGGSRLEIVISDSGTGIRPEHRSRVFDPLFTTKKVGEGTGLGLTVSYAIVKKYGGDIAFETRTRDEGPRPGTTFVITFPPMPDEGTHDSFL